MTAKRFYYRCPRCFHALESSGYGVEGLRCPHCKAVMTLCSKEQGKKKALYEKRARRV